MKCFGFFLADTQELPKKNLKVKWKEDLEEVVEYIIVKDVDQAKKHKSSIDNLDYFPGIESIFLSWKSIFHLVI